MRKRLAGMTIGLAAFVLCACGTTGVDDGCANPARVTRHSDGIPGHWIVVYVDSVAEADQRTAELEKKYHFTASSRFSYGLRGFAAELPAPDGATLRAIGHRRQ